MSDTPRTDAEAGYMDGSGCWKWRDDGSEVPADFARDLERELAAVKRERYEARRTAEFWKGNHLAGNAEIDALRAEVANARPKLIAEIRAEGERRRLLDLYLFDYRGMDEVADFLEGKSDE
jgi:hypothetical protein